MSFLTLKKPDHEYLERFVRAQRTLPVTYPVQSGDLTPTPGFGHTGFRHAGFRHTEVLEPLGSGRAVFERAVAGLEAWAVYPAWMTLYPHHAPIREGEGVALVTGFAPVWTVSAVRIVAVERAARRFSFTLGTSPQHALTGAERFSVVWADDDSVWYRLEAVSRPRHPLTKLGAPVLRLVQARFAVDSVRSLRRFIGC